MCQNHNLRPGYTPFKPWPQKDKVLAGIIKNQRLKDFQREWWKQYFANLPEVSTSEKTLIKFEVLYQLFTTPI
jgi:hypothetical protein